MKKVPKAMIVNCKFAFCIHNTDGKCEFDEVTLSIDGLCENSLDRGKLMIAEKFRKERMGEN